MRSLTVSRFAAVVCSTAVAALLVPTVADAARWRGETSQGRLALVVTGTDGLVGKVRIRYRARCSDGKELNSGVKFLPPFDNSSTTAFADGGTFSFELPDGERARAQTRVEGGLRRSGRWTGSFRVRARITKNGRFVATCRTGRIGWRASPR